MPRFQKWLSGPDPQSPADEVARAALAERLLAVTHFLDKSIGAPDEAEAIHQLRVWTRRASTALEFFRAALPHSERKWLKKCLHKIRRRAGAVRDCDVQLARLASEESKSLRTVLSRLNKDRRQARQRLKSLRLHLLDNQRFALHAQQLLAGVAWPKRHSTRQPPPFAALCRQQLRPLVDDFFSLASADLRDNDALHKLRIAGKQLRYALELTPTVLPPRVQHQLYVELDEIQDRLGQVVDQLAAIDSLKRWARRAKHKKTGRRLRLLIETEQTRLARLRAKVLRWWSHDRRAAFGRLCRKAL